MIFAASEELGRRLENLFGFVNLGTAFGVFPPVPGWRWRSASLPAGPRSSLPRRSLSRPRFGLQIDHLLKFGVDGIAVGKQVVKSICPRMLLSVVCAISDVA